jgi:hypothetical protein
MNLTLGARALMADLDRLAKEKGFQNARVNVKVNAHGELVIAVLIPPRFADEWGPPLGYDLREASRRARQERG